VKIQEENGENERERIEVEEGQSSCCWSKTTASPAAAAKYNHKKEGE
jgi:hypothetical protein